MSKRLLFFVFVLSFFKPIASYCAVTSNGVAHPISISQKKDADHAFKMQHRMVKAESFMAKHGRGLADNAGAQLLLYFLIVGLTLWLIFWLGSRISGAAIGPIILIFLGVALLYALYRYARGYKTLFKSY